LKNDISDNSTSRSAKRNKKLHKKDKILYEHIKKRLKILAEQPEIGKPLRNVLKGRRRLMPDGRSLFHGKNVCENIAGIINRL